MDFPSGLDAPPVDPVTAPSWPIYTAAGSAFLALGCIIPGTHSLTYSVIGYLFGAIAVPALTITFRFCRRSAARDPFFVPRRGVERLVLVMLGSGLVAGVINAWFVATELAKK